MAEYEEGRVYDDRNYNSGPAGTFWVISFLLIIFAFLGGWWANAYYTSNNIKSGFQPGVGGGPGNVVTGSPAPTGTMSNPTPTIKVVTPTPFPTIESPTLSPTPAM